MILSSQKLSPIKNNMKPNISNISILFPQNIYFPKFKNLKKVKKK